MFFFFLSGILGLIPLLWYKGYLLVTEEFFGLDYARWGKLIGETWTSIIGYGGMNLTTYKFQGFVIQAIKSLGFNLVNTQMIWYTLTWVLSALVMYIFLHKLFLNKVPNYILFLATMFYVYTPFFLGISVLSSPPRFIFMILPLVGLLIAKYYESKKSDTYFFLFLISVVLFLGSPVFSNPPQGIALLLFIGLAVAFKNFAFCFRPLKFLKEVAFFTLTFVLLNFWWLFSTFLVFTNRTSLQTQIVNTFSASDLKNTHDVLAQLGLWAFREKVGDYFYYPYNPRYYIFPVVFLKYVPFMFAMYGIYCLSRKYKETSRQNVFVFYAFAFMIFLLLSKGRSGIGGEIFNFLYTKAPFFWVFREPYAKFMPMVTLICPVFIVIGLNNIHTFIVKQHRAAPVGLFFLVTVINVIIMWPFFSTQMHFNVNDGWIRSHKVQFPEYWNELSREWKPTDGLYLLYPTYGLNDYHVWPSGYWGNPYPTLMNVKTLGYDATIDSNFTSNQILSYLYELLLENPERFLRVAPKYNISGLIFQGDIFGDFSKMEERVKSFYGKFLLHTYDKIKIYQFNSASSTVEIHSIENIYKLDPKLHEVYPELKSLVSDDVVFEYSPNASVSEDLGQNELKLADGWKNEKWEDVGDDLDFDKGGLYYKEIIGFDQSKVYTLFLKGTFSIMHSVFLYVVETDASNNIISELFQTEFIPQRINATGSLDVSSRYKFKSHPDARYYFVLKSMNQQNTLSLVSYKNFINQLHLELREKNSLNKNILAKIQLTEPKVYEPTLAETTKLSDSFYVVKHPTKKDIMLQFKQSYNKNWVRVPIDETTYARFISKNSVVFRTLIGCKYLATSFLNKPVNLEYYSNGWVTKDNYSLIFYYPTVVFNVSFTLSAVVLLIGCIWVIKRKR